MEPTSEENWEKAYLVHQADRALGFGGFRLMDFRIADTFTGALARLPAAEQKAVKVSVLDLQLDPSGPGLQMHRIDKSKDANFWSARVNRDLRLILHKTEASILVGSVSGNRPTR